jgi:MATE family multidrug resistance protein
LIGEAVGRRNRDAFRIAVRTVFLWAAVVATLNVAIYAVAGAGIIALLTSIAEVRLAAGEYLLWAVWMPAISVWCYTYDGIFLGATRTRVMRNAMLVAFAIYAGGIYGLTAYLGNDGLWLALALFLGLRGVTLAASYPRLVRSIG